MRGARRSVRRGLQELAVRVGIHERAELALVRTRQDRYDEAVELLDRARELDPQPALTIPLAAALRGRFLNSVAPGNQDDLVRAERILIGELAAATAADVQEELDGHLDEVVNFGGCHGRICCGLRP